MDSLLLAVKWLAQVLIVGSGISALFSESYTEDPNTRHRNLTGRGWMTISAVLAGFIVFAFTDAVERQEKVAKASQARAEITSLKEIVGSQKQLLESQEKLLDNQTRELTLQEQQLVRVRRLDLGRWMLGSARLSWSAAKEDLGDLKELIEKALAGIARLSVESSGSRVTHSTTPSCV